MSDMIKHHTRLARKWGTRYSAWERGTCTSPSMHDLVMDLESMTMTTLDDAERDTLADQMFDWFNEGCTLTELAELALAEVAVTEQV